jgi:hypothetical protein
MLDNKKTLLVVTDLQGKLARIVVDSGSVLRNIGILIDGCKILDIPILWLEQYPEGLGPTLPEISFHLNGYAPIPKKSFSAIKNIKILKHFIELNRSQVLLTGVETHVCIFQTASDFISLGTETYVVKDGVSSRTEFNKNIGIEKILQAGGKITSVETALFELLGSSEGENFKKILNLVK